MKRGAGGGYEASGTDGRAKAGSQQQAADNGGQRLTTVPN